MLFYQTPAAKSIVSAKKSRDFSRSPYAPVNASSAASESSLRLFFIARPSSMSTST